MGIVARFPYLRWRQQPGLLNARVRLWFTLLQSNGTEEYQRTLQYIYIYTLNQYNV